MARRRQRGTFLFAAGIVVSALAHPTIALLWEATRPIPKPKLVVTLAGEGSGQVMVLADPEPIVCDAAAPAGCRAELEEGTRIKLVAVRGEGATFEGWEGPCGAQSHRVFRWAQDILFENATYEELEARAELFDFLVDRAQAPIPEWPLECEVRVDRTTEITASFGLVPEEVDVEWLAMDDEEEREERPLDDGLVITLPDPTAEADRLLAPLETLPDEMPLDEPEPEPPPEIAAVEPPPPTIPVPDQTPPPPPPPEEHKPETYRMKSVEVPDENEVEEEPDDATFLSDKNRHVEVESHARDTNLERASEGEVRRSEESEVESEEIGAEEDRIAQLEETEPSDLDARREDESAHSGESETAKGVITGDEGEDGDEGESGDDTPAEDKGVMAMRGIDGRGSPGGPVEVEREVQEEGPGSRHTGDGGRAGRRGQRGRVGIKTQLEHEDYERIVGEDTAREEVALARRRQSARQGRWERKQGAIMSALENFTPEVQPGNQTALRTRAAPFALYIARMHRRIHELWGFGFLESLDDKPSTHEMNNWSLWTKIEVVLNPDGTIDKLTIVRPSGVLPFDVAALDTVYTASPYEPPPEKIRSANGKVYLHWSFHRDWRQCGTFGVDPFILTDPPSGDQDRGLDDGDLVRNTPRRRANRGAAGQGRGERERAAPQASGDAAAATARATANMPAPDDPRAEHVSNLWLTGFTRGDIDKMIGVSGVPFRSGDQIVATRSADLAAVYRTILSETGDRRPQQARLLSAAGYRRLFGALPPGVEGVSELFFVVRLRGEQFTLVLVQVGEGEYRVVGFNR